MGISLAVNEVSFYPNDTVNDESPSGNTHSTNWLNTDKMKRYKVNRTECHQPNAEFIKP
jgi:hypothetical protein